jgi:hypothetical protein
MIAESVIVGIHLLSAHVPHSSDLREVNPGIYVRADGYTLGVYQNSLSRISVYAGYTLETENKVFALTLGFLSGYQRVQTDTDCNDPKIKTIRTSWPRCYTQKGGSKTFLAPLIAPSMALPTVFNIVPRLTYAPKQGSNTSHVFHLSIERSY